MKNKYVATVMRRHYITPDVFAFSCDHTILGNVNEENGIFTDRNGNEYDPMMSVAALNYSSPFCYANIIEFADLKNEFPDCENNQEAIQEYENSCSDAIYLVAHDENNRVKCLIYDLNLLREVSMNNNADIEITDMSELEEQIKEAMANDDSPEMSENFKQLIIKVVNGDYSLEELYDIRNDLLTYYGEFEQALDTVELQIEATEKGESFIKIANRKKNESQDDTRQMFRRSDKPFTPHINRKKLLSEIKKTLIAQDKPAERVVTEIIRKELGSKKKKEAILLTGSSGVGKTELMRLIAKYINKPFFIVDSTQLTIPGYTGRDIEEVLWELYAKCGGDVELAESAIIYFDEIDKKGSGKKSDVSGQGVLNCLLPFIEGTTYQAKESSKSNESIEISTENMTVILGGAFTSVYKDVNAKSNIGFNPTPVANRTPKTPTTEDFITKGQMTNEFMGRVTVIHLNDLSVEDLMRIMRESDASATRKQEEIFKLLGTNITFTDAYTRAVAEIAHKNKTGARGLNGIIDESTSEAFGEVYDNPGEYEEVVFDRESVTNPSSYQLVKRKELINK